MTANAGDGSKRPQRADVASAPTIPLDGSASPGGPQTDPAVRHAVGQVLGGRYGIVRFVARGGVGAVYEAWDRELEQSVALKALLAPVAGDEAAIARFKREIQLARLVTHPNVCRIFELGVHGGGAEDGEPPELFLTMELLDGRTLADELAERGRLSPPEALAIARQLAEGLAAAHEAGVVHGDLKSANVILVPRGGGVRAVITDFGLARAPQAAGVKRVRERMIGTPAYMAPEQVSGGEIAPAADVYAFGVVLFEMVTGRLPFLARTPAETAALRLSEDPPAPRSIVPELDAAWDAAILRCLARAPGERFAGAREVVAALAEKRHPVRMWRALLGIFLALVAGVLALATRRAGPEATTVVLPLRPEPEAARDTWVGNALREGATAALTGRVVDGAEALAAAQDLSLGETARLTDENLARLRKRLGVTRVIEGTYRAGATGAIELRLTMQDATSGAVLAEAGAAAPRDEAASAGARAVAELKAGGDVEAAARLGAARAWLAAGDADRAREAAQPLCAAGRAGACELAGDPQTALALLAPRARGLEELLLLARVAEAAGRRDDALAALQRADALGSDDARPALAEARLTYDVDAQRSLAAAERALALADARGARGAQVEALMRVGWMRFHQGDVDGAQRAAQRGQALAAALGRRVELVETLGLLAGLGWQRGAVRQAAARQDEVVALAREVGDAGALREALNNAGMMHLRAGDVEPARARFAEALEVGGADYGAARFGLAWLRAVGGDEAGARAAWRELLPVEKEEYVRVFFTIRLGELDARAGDAAARAGLEAALAAADRAGIVALRAEARVALAELLLDGDHPAEAEALLAAAASEAGPLEARDVLAHAASIRARLALRRGDTGAARAALAEALGATHEDELMRLHILAEVAGARRQLAADAAALDAEVAATIRAARQRGLIGPAQHLEAAAR